jgi:DNA-binding LytR/AlgR family response regulator
MKTQEIAIGGRKKVIPTDIMFLVADVNYTTVFLENGNKMFVATPMARFEEWFSDFKFFFRPHKSFMVNLRYVESFEASTILMKNQFSVAVSRRKRELLKANLVVFKHKNLLKT